MREHYIPTGHSETELVEKRSRFISQIWRVETEAEARAHLEAVRKKYYDARHHCWCYLLKEGAVRYSDDGEPQGTAGQPMLNVFQRQEVAVIFQQHHRFDGGACGVGGKLAAAEQRIVGRICPGLVEEV